MTVSTLPKGECIDAEDWPVSSWVEVEGHW